MNHPVNTPLVRLQFPSFAAEARAARAQVEAAIDAGDGRYSRQLSEHLHHDGQYQVESVAYCDHARGPWKGLADV